MFSLLMPFLVAYAVPTGATEEGFERGIASNVQFRAELFANAGLPPIETVAAAGGQVRRLHLRVWLPFSLPIMEIERLRKDFVVMRLYRDGSTVQEHAVAPSVWRDLEALDREVLRPPVFDPERLNRKKTWSSCHGDTISLQVAKRRKAYSVGGNQCVDSVELYTGPMKAALAIFSKAAVQTQPACRADHEKDPTRALERCFGPRS